MQPLALRNDKYLAKLSIGIGKFLRFDNPFSTNEYTFSIFRVFCNAQLVDNAFVQTKAFHLRIVVKRSSRKFEIADLEDVALLNPIGARRSTTDTFNFIGFFFLIKRNKVGMLMKNLELCLIDFCPNLMGALNQDK